MDAQAVCGNCCLARIRCVYRAHAAVGQSAAMSRPEPYSPSILTAGIRPRLIDTVNGLTVHVLEAGFSAGTRPSALLLHGFPEVASSWRKVIRPLGDRSFQVLASDLGGYGRTSGWDDHYDTDLRSFGLLNLCQGRTRTRIHPLLSVRCRSRRARFRLGGLALVFNSATGRFVPRS